MIIISSFPRSGNHLTRFLIEYLTGRPTMGCMDNPRDIPIFRTEFSENPSVLSHVSGPRIGFKSHKVYDNGVLINLELCERLILIQREPAEAILAHHVRTGKLGRLLKQKKKIKRSIKNYFALEKYYEEFSQKKSKIVYENLISPNKSDYLPELQKLADICSPHVDSQRFSELCEDFTKFRTISSQGKFGDWGGYNSQGKSDYYQSKMYPVTKKLFDYWIKKYSV
ncbi:MAG: hypothetical protein ABJN78_03205 [Hyphomicrobiales bacterium]